MSQTGFCFPVLNYVSDDVSDPFVLGMLRLPAGRNDVEVKSGQIKLLSWYWYCRQAWRFFFMNKNVCINPTSSANQFYWCKIDRLYMKTCSRFHTQRLTIYSSIFQCINMFATGCTVLLSQFLLKQCDFGMCISPQQFAA